MRTNNPDYKRTGPSEQMVNGIRCVNLDGALLADAARMGRKP